VRGEFGISPTYTPLTGTKFKHLNK